MKEDDLLWIIAIKFRRLRAGSGRHERGADSEFLPIHPVLSAIAFSSGGSTSATLEVEIKRIDPEELMEQMGFNEDARQWAGTPSLKR